MAATARAALRARDRDTLKVAAVGHLFRGRRAAELDELGRAYVPTLVGLLRPEMVDRVRWHRAEGHAIVIVSASIGAYLRPLADAPRARRGAGGGAGGRARTGCSPAPSSATSTPEVPRRWPGCAPGPAQRFGVDAPFELWAYGDSSGDEELLALADHPTWVGRRAGGPA